MPNSKLTVGRGVHSEKKIMWFPVRKIILITLIIKMISSQEELDRLCEEKFCLEYILNFCAYDPLLDDFKTFGNDCFMKNENCLQNTREYF